MGDLILYCLIKTSRIPNVRHLHSSRDPTALFKDGKLKEYWGLVHVIGVTQNMQVILKGCLAVWIATPD